MYASTADLEAGQSENRSDYERNIKSREQNNDTRNNKFGKNLEKLEEIHLKHVAGREKHL